MSRPSSRRGARARRPIATLLTLAAACSAPPAPPPTPTAGDTQTAAAPDAPTGPGAAVTDRALRRLPNGLTAYLEVAPRGGRAQVQLGVFAGSLFAGRGLADTAARVLLESSDPTTGRPSLRTAASRLGGTIDVHVGLTSTWFELRLPPDRVPEALAALRRALGSTTQSRTQIERMRDELVAARSRAIVADPIGSGARALMHAEPGTDAWLDGLLDVDPGAVDLFLSRLYRPERCYLAVRAPQPFAGIEAMVRTRGDDAIADWRPAPPIPGETGPMARSFASGLYWAEATGARDRVQVALLMQLPDPLTLGAAEWLVAHACLTLGGTGGRLERLQEEAGLAHVTWQSRLHQTPDVLALELTTTVTPAEAAALWRVYQRARRSLAEVPPSESELRIALRRAQLDARAIALDDGAWLRLNATLTARGVPPEALRERIVALAKPGAFDAARAAEVLLASPAWMLAVGAPPPDGVDGLRRFELVPPGFLPAGQAAPDPDTVRSAQPWLLRARAAAGGGDWLRRLDGFAATAATTADAGPEAVDELRWNRDGTLHRRRRVLGSEIVTQLAADEWTEQLGDAKQPLSRAEAERLRDEMRRHPTMLLAATARGELEFRTIAQRTVGDRDFMVLEAVGARFDRLRIHVDVESGLVRTVESWQRLADDALVHVRESWSDYRQVGALRVPHRRRSSWNDGLQQVETTWTDWRPTFAGP